MDDIYFDPNCKQRLDMELLQLMVEMSPFHNMFIQNALRYMDTLCSTRFELFQKQDRKFVVRVIQLAMKNSQMIIDTGFCNDLETAELAIEIESEDFEYLYTRFLLGKGLNFLSSIQKKDLSSYPYKVQLNKVLQVLIKKSNELLPEAVQGL